MSDQPVRTRIRSERRVGQPAGVHDQAACQRADRGDRVRWRRATPAPSAAVLDGAGEAPSAIVIGPSNPVISIGPILALARNACCDRRGAAAPVDRGQPDRRRRGAQGADRRVPCAGLGMPADAARRRSPTTAALVDGIVGDEPIDAIPALRCDTLMSTPEQRRAVATRVLEFAGCSRLSRWRPSRSSR